MGPAEFTPLVHFKDTGQSVEGTGVMALHQGVSWTPLPSLWFLVL